MLQGRCHPSIWLPLICAFGLVACGEDAGSSSDDASSSGSGAATASAGTTGGAGAGGGSDPGGGGAVSLPDWADYEALPEGTFIEFTLNTPSDVGMQRSSLYNWVGGAFVPDYGARGGVCYHGGGEHSVWTDSSVSGPGQQGVYVLDCDARTYVRRCYPAVDHTGVVSTGVGTATDDWGAYTDDGSPQSKHTYNGMSYMPAAWGGGPQGSLVRVAHSGGISTSLQPTGEAAGPGYAATWRFDLSKDSHTSADPSIHKLTETSTYDYGNSQPARVNDASFACIDTTREGWWSTHRAGSGWGNGLVFTSKSGEIGAPYTGVFSTSTWCAMHHFADDDLVVFMTDDLLQNGTVPSWDIYVWPAGTAAPATKVAVNRQDIDDVNGAGVKAYPSIGYMHPRWSTILGSFVGLDSTYPYGNQPTTTVRVWKITPPPPGERLTGTWEITWELVSAKPGSPESNQMNMVSGDVRSDAGTLNGIYGRFVESPSLRAFVWTRDVDKPGQLFRLKGM